MRISCVGAFLFAAAAAAAVGAAELDPVALEVAAGSPQWTRVAAPPLSNIRTSPGTEVSDNGEVSLERGDSVQLLVPAATSLEVFSEQTIGPGEILIYTADGNGLGCRMDFETGLDASKPRILIEPDLRSRLIRIEGGPELQTDKQLRLAQRSILPTRITGGYRALELPGDEPVDDRLGFFDRSRRRAVLVDAWSPLEFEVDGPQHLRISVRLAYSAEMTDHRQSCELETVIDEGARAVHHLDFIAGGEPVVLGGRIIAASQPSAAFLDLPEGRHRVRLVAPRRLVISVERTAWLAPLMSWSRVDPEPADVWRRQSAPSTGEHPGLLEELEQLRVGLRQGAEEPGAFEITRLLDALALGHLESPRLRSFANLVAGRLLFFRDLEPLASRQGLRRSAYHRRNLKTSHGRRPASDRQPTALPASLAASFAGSLPTAVFASLAADETLEFQLPPLPATAIRVAVLAPPGWSEKLLLASDAGDLKEILLDPLLVAPEEMTRATLASIADGLEREVFNGLGAPFRKSPPLPVDPASSLEVEVSSGCRRVRLSRTGGGAPLGVAVAVKVERSADLAEQTVIDMLAAYERRDALGAAARETLGRVFEGERRRWEDALAGELEAASESPLPWRLDDRSDAPVWDHGADPIIELERLAADLREQGGGWAHVDLVVRALDRLGESFLARGLLRAVALKAPTQGLRHEAARAWLDRARAAGENGLSAAIALARSRPDDPVGQVEVGEELLAGGDPYDALWQASAAGADGRDLLDRASNALGWWGLIPGVDARAWARVAAWLEPTELQRPDRGFPTGDPGLEVYRRLMSGDLAVRAGALLEWEALAHRPAEPIWRRLDRRAVKAHSGGILIRFRRSGNVGRRWLASPDHPLVLETAPGHLRLETRAFLPAGRDRSDPQWLEVSLCGLTRPVLLGGGPAAGHLEMPARMGDRLGVARDVSLEIPAGCWEVEIRPEEDVIAVAVDRLGPGSWSLLPVLEPEHAMRVVLRPDRERAALPPRMVVLTPPVSPERPLDLAGEEDDQHSVKHRQPIAGDGISVQPEVSGAIPNPPGLSGLPISVAARLGLRFGSSAEPGWLEAVTTETSHGPESIVAAARWKGVDEACENEAVDAESAALVASACAAANRFDRALAVLSREIARVGKEERPGLLVRRLELILFATDHGLFPRRTAVAEAAALAESYPGEPILVRLADHALANTSWTRLTPSRSAGLRLVGVPGWHRSGTAMRARFALLYEPPDAGRVLAGSESISVEFGNDTPSTTRLELAAIGLPIFRPMTMTAAWRLRDQSGDEAILTEGSVDLAPGQREIAYIEIPAGRSRLEIEILGPQPNQMVSVDLDEVGEEGVARQILIEKALSRRLRFDIARPDQPVEVAIDGPAWVRVDHLTDLGVRPTYHRIEDGPRTFRVEGEHEELVRLWVLEPTPAEPRPIIVEGPRSTAAPEGAAPGEPLESLADPRAEALIEGSADATRKVSAFWRRRAAFDEDDSGDDEEEHLEVRFDRLLLMNPYHHRESHLLARLHEGTDLVVGVSDVHRLMVSGWRLRLGARLYAQAPVGRDVTVASPWWSATGDAGIERTFPVGPRLVHRPRVATTLRLLGVDEDDAEAIGTIDNDVWTPYKADHRFVLRLADRLEYRPRDDMRLQARAAVTTNENPAADGIDNIRFALSAHQLIGEVEARVFVLATTYFADRDRVSQFTRPLVGVDLRLDRWILNRHRVVARLYWRHEIDSGRDSIAAGITWVFENGLPWRNEAPGTDVFRSRKRRLAAERAALDVDP